MGGILTVKQPIKVFKVVQRGDKNKDYSRLATGKARVRYNKNKWSKAPKWLRQRGYHLFAFIDFGYAYDFAREIPDDEVGVIWEAEAREVTFELPPRCERENLAQGNLVFKSERDLAWAAGTVMCEEIMPKQVKRVVHGNGPLVSISYL